jgi:sulfur carrier protein
MNIILNGEPATVPDACSVADLIQAQRLAGQRLAVELNGAIVVRSRWAEVRLAENDRAEIVRAVGGG